MYDDNNIFAKIIRKEVSANILFENESLIVLNDINPVANVHLLFIPKLNAISFDDFMKIASESQVNSFFKSIQDYAEKIGVADFGYKIVMNHKSTSGQEVFHFHAHLLSDCILS